MRVLLGSPQRSLTKNLWRLALVFHTAKDLSIGVFQK